MINHKFKSVRTAQITFCMCCTTFNFFNMLSNWVVSYTHLSRGLSTPTPAYILERLEQTQLLLLCKCNAAYEEVILNSINFRTQRELEKKKAHLVCPACFSPEHGPLCLACLCQGLHLLPIPKIIQQLVKITSKRLLLLATKSNL
jgi:hypothetical protein